MAVRARDSDLTDYKLLSNGAEMSTAAFIESNSFRCSDNNNRFCIPAFHQKVIAVALTLWLRSDKTIKRVGNMLPEIFPANTCFPYVPPFFLKRNGVSRSKKCFCTEGKTCFAARNNVSRVAKLGNIGETCVRSKCFWQHVSGSFCQGLSKDL